MFRATADVRSAAQLGLDVRAVTGGHPVNVVVTASEGLEAYVASLVERAERVRSRLVRPEEDNMLKVAGDGRRAALDLRLVGLPPGPGRREDRRRRRPDRRWLPGRPGLSVRSNQADVTNAVCGVLCALRTDLVIVDEIHNLNLATRAGAEVSDQLKYLSERIPATFVYAGIDVAGIGLFGGTRGRQIAGRFATLPTAAFPYGSAAQRQQWQALVTTLEQALRLHSHRPGTLLKLDSYLHQRTDGMIGSLSHLIRGAAIEAVLDGSETITKATLDAVHLDHAAEHANLQRSRTRTPGRQAAS